MKSFSSPKRKRRGYLIPPGPRHRQKSKKLEAICEEEYNRNHGESKKRDGLATSGASLELRRSSRVRKAPEILDVSPLPAKKRPRITKKAKFKTADRLKNYPLRNAKDGEDLDTPGPWKNRLRSKGRSDVSQENEGCALRGRRRLFEERSLSKGEKQSGGSQMEESEESDAEMSKEPSFNKESISSGTEGEEAGTCDVKIESTSYGVEMVEKSSDDAVDIEASTTDSGSENDVGKDREEADVYSTEANLEEEREVLHNEQVREERIRAGNVEIENDVGKERGEADVCSTEAALEEEREVLHNEQVREGNVEIENDVGKDREETDVYSTEAALEEEREVLHNEQVREERISTGNVKTGMQPANEAELLECVQELGQEYENQQNAAPVEDNCVNDVEENKVIDEHDRSVGDYKEEHVEGEVCPTADESNCITTYKDSRPRFRQERQCGLCGGGTDGKPPKKSVRDAGESDVDAHSGTSVSEEPNYDIWDGFGDEPGWLGRLLGPINDRYGIAGIWVHQHCAVWSPEVYFAGLGCLKNVRAALCRGRTLKCTRCGRPGATIGCRVDRCPKTYHLPCARANGCIFDHRKFLIACTDHRHLFQPQGRKYEDQIKKLKAKKMKLEMRKLSNDASRKDVEAEEKWLENCGEDEEFLKRESKRLHRDLLRIAPVYIGGSDSESRKHYEGWDSVAGLQHVINCMKEVVILPLLYPEFFDNLGLTPPRGVLLHGYPGTGKTLVVRALIGSLARGDKRIAYFARKGADCLGKYVGDAERQLRLLFQVAEKCQPSIIFFDEIDGLAPRRTRQQDQTHSSVVSTLLALLDGLKSRGSVVVIGATNRPDAVDPALRRPGRFDREIYFPLPSVEDRAAIISLHTRKWPKPVAGPLLKWIAKMTVGFAGADLQALCTQAAIIALKRNFPLHEVMSAAQVEPCGTKRVALPEFSVKERDWVEALSRSPPPCSRREAGIAASDMVSAPLPMHLVPCLLQPLSALLVFFHLDERLWLPPPLFKVVANFKRMIVSALSSKGLPSDKWWRHANDILQEADVAQGIVRELCYAGILTQECYLSGTDASSDDNSDHSVFDPCIHAIGRYSAMSGPASFYQRKNSGFRVLITGNPRCGQRHLASCILHCFVGNVEVQKVDLATISREGCGDMVQGVTHLLISCASRGSCVIFMPRIDLWALELHSTEEICPATVNKNSHKPSFSHTQVVGQYGDLSLKQPETEEMSEPQISVGVSHAWSSFVEQVESMSVSTSIMILATSGVPYEELPERIRHYFKPDLTSCGKSTSSETVPRFAVSVGTSFNHSMAIDVSALELSMTAIQTYVHLLHQGTHTHEISHKNYEEYGLIEGFTDRLDKSRDPDSGKEAQDNLALPDGYSKKVQASPSSKNLKAKSSLLLAISTFGYQILRYPHFAELCWVTSKLKEGPSADVSGPWKGWPFNSCIIRPGNSLQNSVAVNVPSSDKRKESFSVVRGLIAIGLSAYRGIYSSAREVAFEVRKVLELLVAQIDAKVSAGKDRYQYVRLLSQVAFLEDMVNSWAYALRELDSQTEMANPERVAVRSQELGIPDPNNQLQPINCDDSFQKADEPEDNPKGAQNISSEHIYEKSSNSIPYCDGKVACATPGLGQKNIGHTENLDLAADAQKRTVFGLNDLQYILTRVSTRSTNCEDSNNKDSDFIRSFEEIAADPGDTLNQQIGLPDLNCSVTTPLVSGALDVLDRPRVGPTELDTTGSISASNAPAGLLNFSNGITKMPCLSDNGAPGSSGFSRSSQMNDLPSVKHTDASTICSRESAGPVDDSAVVCLYHCCSKCLHSLQDLMQKLLVQKWGLNKKDLTVEDVHDAVASVSVGLLSKADAVISCSNVKDEKLRHVNGKSLSNFMQKCTVSCGSSGEKLVEPVECCKHSTERSATEADIFPNSKPWFDPVFRLRDGIFVPVDSSQDLSSHCNFENLCLCTIIDTLESMMQPSD